MLLDQFTGRLEHVGGGRYGLGRFEHQKRLFGNPRPSPSVMIPSRTID